MRDFMEAAKKLQSYFISLQREDRIEGGRDASEEIAEGMGLIGVVACTGDSRRSGIGCSAFGAAILINHRTEKMVDFEGNVLQGRQSDAASLLIKMSLPTFHVPMTLDEL